MISKRGKALECAYNDLLLLPRSAFRPPQFFIKIFTISIFCTPFDTFLVAFNRIR